MNDKITLINSTKVKVAVTIIVLFYVFFPLTSVWAGCETRNLYINHQDKRCVLNWQKNYILSLSKDWEHYGPYVACGQDSIEEYYLEKNYLFLNSNEEILVELKMIWPFLVVVLIVGYYIKKNKIVFNLSKKISNILVRIPFIIWAVIVLFFLLVILLLFYLKFSII